ncbi:unnamed protein product [Amaranthus hypochondriacus]
MERFGYGTDGIYRSLRPPLIMPSDPNLDMVSFFFRNIHSYPELPALIDSNSGDVLNFSQLKSMVAKLSHGLTQLGFQKGDVLMFAPNSVIYPITFLGIIAIGAITTTINSLYTLTEIKKQVQDYNPKLIVTVPELWDKVKGLNLPALILGFTENGYFDPNSKIVYYSDLINGSCVDFPKVLIKQNDTAALLYSSGTTGVSKGVILTHKNFISASLMISNDQEFEGDLHELIGSLKINGDFED